jgi:type I restriction enzyme S subunit
MTFNQSCYALAGRGGTGSAFVYLAAQNMVSTLKAMSHGSVFSTITRDTFHSITMPKASPKLLAAFEIAASCMFDQIKSNVLESRTLAQTRDMLLPKLMSGEIRVADGARTADDAAGVAR